MKTTAVHIRDPHDFKACRSPKGEVPDYPEYFYERIKVDKNFLNGILSLRGKRLACFCKPKACHCDVIVEFLDNHDNC